MSSRRWWVALLVGVVIGYGIGAVVYHLTPLPGGAQFFWLVIAGGFGGIINGIVNDGGQGKIRFPRWVETSEKDAEADLGFLGEMLVGMLGAMVSVLVIALFLGKDPFGVADVNISIFRLVGFGSLAGFAARQFLPNLSKRFTDLVERKVETLAAAAERDLERQAALQGELQKTRTEVTRLTAEVAQKVVEPIEPGMAAALPVPNVDDLAPLVAEFDGITYATHPEYERRVEAMMDVAARMVAALPANTPTIKQLLSDRVQATGDKGWLVPLATVIATLPRRGDAKRLFDAFDRALATPQDRERSKFILYRVLLAITSLKDARRLPREEAPRARAIAEACRAIDDANLKRRAEAVLTLLG